MASLDGTVRMVALQFSFSNPDTIPASVKRRDPETKGECVERKNHSSGFLVIEPTEKCSLAELPGELETTGFEMVDAFCKERLDPKDPSGKRTYHMARFQFARREIVKLSDEFKKVRDIIRAELQTICETAMWRVRAFDNPFYKNGEEIPGQRSISINLEVRTPLFRPDGQPVTVWSKDGNGKRLGDSPLPIRPGYCLRVVNNAIQLVMA